MASKNPNVTSETPVKKENEEEIKEFAETAMNELLGWYGYERLELRRWAASRARDGSSPEHNEHKNKDECVWCNKRTRDGGAIQHAGSTYCSDLCFSQSRRANFKRAKTCDWCRHVRHTVAYVDFQDGATQLQFCSDKCLNQYKMHIFCRETQAHLDLNPQLMTSASSSNLITPDLWLRNCRSRSTSPGSEKTKSDSPGFEASNTAKTTKCADKTEEKTTTSHSKQRKSPQPKITVAPTAKLMEKTKEKTKSSESKKDRPLKMNLRKRRTSKCSATVTSQSLRKSSSPKAQDLRMRSPSNGTSSASTVNSVISPPPHPINMNPIPMPHHQYQNHMYMPPYMENNHEMRHAMFPPRMSNFLPRMPMPMMHDRLRSPMHYPHINQPPPVTVLVPYPVILPIPLPIPIPMPMASFVQAHKMKVKIESKDDEGPLDYTMNGEKNKNYISEQDTIQETIETSLHDGLNSNSEINEKLDESEPAVTATESGNPEQTLPKFKITKSANKMAKIVAKPREISDANRPLRKRRRLVEVVAEDDQLISKTMKSVEV